MSFFSSNLTIFRLFQLLTLSFEQLETVKKHDTRKKAAILHTRVTIANIATEHAYCAREFLYFY